MRTSSHSIFYGVSLVCGLCLLSGCNDQPAAPGSETTEPAFSNIASFGAIANGYAGGATIEFADLEMFLEFNSTDNDLGVHISLDAKDWKRVRARNSNHKTVLDIATGAELRALGLTQLFFESAEPSPQEVLDLFAPGDYEFSGITIEGERLEGIASLSHDLPPAPTITTPANGAVLDATNIVIVWNPIPGLELFEFIIGNENTGASMTVELAPSVTSFEVPAVLIQPDTEYKFEVLAVLPTGNRTITEQSFSTKP